MSNNNDFGFIRARIDADLMEAFKRALEVNNITIQEFVEKEINDYVIKNLKLILKSDDKGLEIEKWKNISKS